MPVSPGLSWAGQLLQRGIFGSPGCQHVGGEGERDSLSVSPLPSALPEVPKYYASMNLEVKPPGFCQMRGGTPGCWDWGLTLLLIRYSASPCLLSDPRPLPRPLATRSGTLCVLHIRACLYRLSLVRVWASASSLCVDFHNVVHSLFYCYFSCSLSLVGFSF